MIQADGRTPGGVLGEISVTEGIVEVESLRLRLRLPSFATAGELLPGWLAVCRQPSHCRGPGACHLATPDQHNSRPENQRYQNSVCASFPGHHRNVTSHRVTTVGFNKKQHAIASLDLRYGSDH